MILALRGIGHAHVPRVLQGLALVAGLGLSIGFIRTAVLYPFYLKAGLRLNDARRIFDEFKRSQPSGVVYQASYSLWVLSEDYARMRVVIPTQSHLNPKEPYVLQQSYMGPAFQRPPVLPGFQLQKSFFVSGVPRLWGLKIASTMPGYGFSVYRPDSGAPLNKG
jgi:hypothetical protein